MSTDEGTNDTSLGTKIPVFSGKAEHFAKWARRVNLWKDTLSEKDKKHAGAKLVNAQSDEFVLDCLLEVEDSIIKSEAGVDALIEKLRSYYGKPDETNAWSVFLAWYNAKRKKGEPVDDFGRVFMNRYAKVRSFDPDVKVSDRMLGLLLLMQMNLSVNVRGHVLGVMKGDISPPKVIQTIGDLYTFDVAIDESEEEKHTFFSEKKRKPSFRPRQRRHPLEGDGVAQQNKKGKSGQQLRCYDCDSVWHLAGHHMCPKKQESMFAVELSEEDAESVEYAGLAFTAGDGTEPPFKF